MKAHLFEQNYRAALDGLAFSGEEKARIIQNLTEQKEPRVARRPQARLWRVGLIAACLCLAIVGMAAAVYFSICGSRSPTRRGSCG